MYGYRTLIYSAGGSIPPLADHSKFVVPPPDRRRRGHASGGVTPPKGGTTNWIKGISMRKDLVRTSKFLSLVLRHKPETIGLRLDKNGWADVEELLAKARMSLDFAMLAEVVETNDKKRFSFNAEKTKIRANQGHSINVDLKLEPLRPPDVLYHGTATRFWRSISEKGLIKGNRQYVHLSKDTDTAEKIGARHGKPLILKIESGRMFQNGHRFFLSENGVWMIAHVPVNYLKKMTDAENKRPPRLQKVKSCGVLCVRDASCKQFLLLRHPHRWDIPKGHMEKNESEHACALRELFEETGIRERDMLLDPDFRFEHTYFPKYKRFGGERVEKTVIVFLGRLLSPVQIVTTEHSTFQWVDWQSSQHFSSDTIDKLLKKARQHM